jgi:hypothetical protein
MNRRPELLSSVILRQNPHNVAEWHKRVRLFEGKPTKQILTYTEAVRVYMCGGALVLCAVEAGRGPCAAGKAAS